MSLNEFAITSHKGEILSLTLQKKFTKEQAMNLASWLVAFLYMEDDILREHPARENRKEFFHKFNELVEENLNS